MDAEADTPLFKGTGLGALGLASMDAEAETPLVKGTGPEACGEDLRLRSDSVEVCFRGLRVQLGSSTLSLLPAAFRMLLGSETVRRYFACATPGLTRDWRSCFCASCTSSLDFVRLMKMEDGVPSAFVGVVGASPAVLVALAFEDRLGPDLKRS